MSLTKESFPNETYLYKRNGTMFITPSKDLAMARTTEDVIWINNKS
jgi:hypothetical protein